MNGVEAEAEANCNCYKINAVPGLRNNLILEKVAGGGWR